MFLYEVQLEVQIVHLCVICPASLSPVTLNRFSGFNTSARQLFFEKRLCWWQLCISALFQQDDVFPHNKKNVLCKRKNHCHQSC